MQAKKQFRLNTSQYNLCLAGNNLKKMLTKTQQINPERYSTSIKLTAAPPPAASFSLRVSPFSTS
jgi:hypothetical protein